MFRHPIDMRRVVIPELLDADAGTPREIAASLRDLRRIASWFGGIATTRKMVHIISRESGRRRLSLLDVAAGDGHLALSVQRRMAAGGIDIELTLLERNLHHLGIPLPRRGTMERRATVHEDDARTPRLVVGDALALPFRDDAFDLVTCSLFAHHLEPPQLRYFLSEALRVSRLGVLINDLRRSAVSLALVYAGLPLFRSRLTHHDAPASVRRAYTMEELLRIAALVPQVQRTLSFNHFLFRMGVILYKAPGEKRDLHFHGVEASRPGA